MAAIALEGLSKRYGKVTAVDELTLTIPEGEVFGFLGPNGAGKSTTVNLMLDFIRPTRGRVEVLGMDAQEDPVEIRRRVGVLPEGYGFEDELVGREYVEWAIETKGAHDDQGRLLEQVGLAEAADRPARAYSKGMQQRLAFAMALVGDPDLLILDEPSTGLDPNGMQHIREVISERAANGTTVFFSSHILSEVQAVCDRVGILNDGRLVAVDSIEGLRQSIGGQATIRLVCASPPTNLGVAALEGVADVEVNERTLEVTCTDPTAKVSVVTHVAEQVEVLDILSETVQLETLFAEVTADDAGSEPTGDRAPVEATE